MGGVRNRESRIKHITIPIVVLGERGVVDVADIDACNFIGGNTNILQHLIFLSEVSEVLLSGLVFQKLSTPALRRPSPTIAIVVCPTFNGFFRLRLSFDRKRQKRNRQTP